MQNSKNSDKGQSWLQLPDGYLDKTPMFQFLLVCLIFPLWGAAASLNDILITQFKTVFTLTTRPRLSFSQPSTAATS